MNDEAGKPETDESSRSGVSELDYFAELPSRPKEINVVLLVIFVFAGFAVLPAVGVLAAGVAYSIGSRGDGAMLGTVVVFTTAAVAALLFQIQRGSREFGIGMLIGLGSAILAVGACAITR